MNLLITSAASPLAQTLATALRADHTLRLTERWAVPNQPELAVSALGHDLSTNLLVRGMTAIIHVAEPLPGESTTQQIDVATRTTYNLCMAAVAEGVSRLIYLSTLDLLAAYPHDFLINERWRPQPTTEPPLLAKHLGECVVREFAREHKLTVTVLRLGHVIFDADAPTTVDPLAVAASDVVQAVQRALVTDTGRWTICHIQHAGPTARFASTRAKRLLGYTPEWTFPQQTR